MPLQPGNFNPPGSGGVVEGKNIYRRLNCRFDGSLDGPKEVCDLQCGH